MTALSTVSTQRITNDGSSALAAFAALNGDSAQEAFDEKQELFEGEAAFGIQTLKAFEDAAENFAGFKRVG